MAEMFFDLQMFAEAGSAPAGADGAVAGEGAASPAAQGENVASPTTNETEDRKAVYNKFKADFKAEYDADMQAAIKDRLKKAKSESQSYKSRIDELTPVVDLIAQHYNVDPTDIKGLSDAIEADDQWYESEAYERGMTVDQVKQFHKLERENRLLRAAEEQKAAQEAAMAQYAEWDRQFAALKQVYPNVVPEVEMQNDNFLRLMNAGVPIQDAFELVHKDELTRGAMQFTANKVAEKLTNAALSNSAHPQENGMSKQAAALTQPSISSMSLDQMKDYIQKAKAGESIDFKSHY